MDIDEEQRNVMQGLIGSWHSKKDYMNCYKDLRAS